MELKKRSYFDALDGFRGLAFLTVLIAHIGQKYRAFYVAGKVGVVVFFILSSFLFIYYFWNESDKYLSIKGWIAYGVKRLFRIYPMYILILLLEVLVGGYSMSKFFRHIFLMEASKHYWTIPVEMTFYVLAPFLGMFILVIMKKKLINILSVLSLFMVGYGLCYEIISSFFRTGGSNEPSLAFYLTPFIFGVALATIQNNINIVNRIVGASIKKIVFVLSFLWIIVICSIPYSYNAIVSANYGFGLFGVFLFYSVLFSIIIFITINTRTMFLNIFESRLLRYIGAISYSGYLIHILILDVVYKLGMPQYLSFLMVVTVTIFFASITNKFVERPFMRIGSNLNNIFQTRL